MRNSASEIQIISISEIKINTGRREIESKFVEELAGSIKDLELMNPITLSADHTLISGLHRIEAAKILGWTEVPCIIMDVVGLQAEMAEIDENIIRRGYGVFEIGEKLLRRKEIYEMMHPETKNGGDRRSQNFRTQNLRSENRKSFVHDTAEKLGLSVRNIETQIQTAKNLTPVAKDILRQSAVSISKTNAKELSRLPPDKQIEAAKMLARGEITSISQFQAADDGRMIEKGNESDQNDVAPEYFPESEDEPKKIRIPTFAENVAYIKSNDKDFSCTPEAFLADVNMLVRQVNQHIAWYDQSYYHEVFAKLSHEQLADLKEMTDEIRRDAGQLYKKIERMSRL